MLNLKFLTEELKDIVKITILIDSDDPENDSELDYTAEILSYIHKHVRNFANDASKPIVFSGIPHEFLKALQDEPQT